MYMCKLWTCYKNMACITTYRDRQMTLCNSIGIIWQSHISQHQTTTTTSHHTTIYVPVTNMPLKCHIYKLIHEQIGSIYANIYASHGLNAINNVTRNSGIHTLYIICIYPWTNMSTTLHKYVPLYCSCNLHIYPALLHTAVKTTKCNIYLPCYCHICAYNKYAPHISQTCNICKFFNCLCDIHTGQLELWFWRARPYSPTYQTDCTIFLIQLKNVYNKLK